MEHMLRQGRMEKSIDVTEVDADGLVFDWERKQLADYLTRHSGQS